MILFPIAKQRVN